MRSFTEKTLPNFSFAQLQFGREVKLVHEQQRLWRKMQLAIVYADENYDRHTRRLKLSEKLPLMLKHSIKPFQVLTDGLLSRKRRAKNQVLTIGLKEIDARRDASRRCTRATNANLGGACGRLH
jgi:hypothetical protein